MCSKRKPNGSSTISFVARAIAKTGHGTETFFAHAGQLTDHRNGTPLLIAAQQFDDVKRRGIGVLPGYEVPECVVRLAKSIHKHTGDPHVFFQNMKKQDLIP